MKILASLCNQAKAASNPTCLVEVDTASMRVKPIFFKKDRVPPHRGVTGLAQDSRSILAVVQRRPNNNSIIVRLSKDYRILKTIRPKTIRSGHSICLKNSLFYVVSTGTNRIVRIGKRERVYWGSDFENRDTKHLNCVAWSGSRILATMFNNKPENGWSTANKGQLIDVTNDKIIRSPIYHPHSIAIAPNGDIYCCESGLSKVISTSGSELLIDDGYTRGLVIAKHHLLVGTSRRRYDLNIGLGNCTIKIYNYNGKLAESRLIGSINLNEFGKEIYDLLLL